MEPTVTLRLIFYGLISFNPNEMERHTPMRALLIDARNPPVASDGCPIHKHTPELIFESPACRFPCRLERGLCRCELKRDLVHIGEEEKEVCSEVSTTPQQVPDDDHSYDDEAFERVSNLSWLRFMRRGMRLRRECNQQCPNDGHEEMCGVIAAQVNFFPDAVATCALSGQRRLSASGTCYSYSQRYEGDGSTPDQCTLPDQSYVGIPPPASDRLFVCAPRYRFRPIASRNIKEYLAKLVSRLCPDVGKHHLAEITRFEQKVALPTQEASDPNASLCPTCVRLEVVAFNRTESYPVLVRTYTETGKATLYADLVIANHAADHLHELDYGRCAGQQRARDFELFHDLVASSPYPVDRDIPHVADEGRLTRAAVDNCSSPLYDRIRDELLRTGQVMTICPKARGN